MKTTEVYSLTYRSLWLCRGLGGCRGKIQECSGRQTVSARATRQPSSTGDNWQMSWRSCSPALWIHCTASATKRQKEMVWPMLNSIFKAASRISIFPMHIPLTMLPFWWAVPLCCSPCRTGRGQTGTVSHRRGYNTSQQTNSWAGRPCG